ncbi:MAG TPA: sulfur carrier protein ThiS [Chthoniobacterales bacterium]|jgi:sulfur carrier protein|nr:sulfur carrier protein ThiS [Chthoniobacterales bacterium]
MRVVLNGEPIDCASGLTITDLIRARNLPLETILVERNGIALRRRDWPNEQLSEGDRIEILQVAAGG